MKLAILDSKINADRIPIVIKKEDDIIVIVNKKILLIKNPHK